MFRWCCCGGDPPFDCTILEDDFTRSDSTDLGSDWSEESGSWSIASNRLSVSGAGLAVTEATRNPDYAYTVTANIDDDMSLVFDYLDSNNYHYLKFEYNHATSAFVRYYKVTSGTPSLLSSQSFQPFLYGISSGNMDMRLCVSDSRIVVTGGTSLDVISGRTLTLHGGTKAGVLSDSAAGTFDDFLFAHYSRSDDCPECTISCETACCDPLPVEEYIVEIDGSAIANGVGGNRADCDDCLKIGGEYTVVRDPFTCTWAYAEDLDCECEACAFTNTGKLTVRVQLIGCRWDVNITLDYVGGFDPDCPVSCDAQSFPYSFNMGSSQDCSDFEYTASFTTSPSFTRTIVRVCSGTMPLTVTLRPA